MRRWMIGAVVGCGAALVWIVSCVNDQANQITPGADGGQCLSNGTCDPGLMCVIQGSTTKCVPQTSDGGGADSPTNDGGPGDGTISDAPKDSPLACDADSAGPITLPSYCGPSTSMVTCFSLGDASANCTSAVTGCGGGAFQAECLSGTTFHCCLYGGQWVDNACYSTLDLTHDASTILSPSFCGGIILCDGSAQCGDAGTCTPTAVSGVPSLTTTIGACR